MAAQPQPSSAPDTGPARGRDWGAGAPEPMRASLRRAVWVAVLGALAGAAIGFPLGPAGAAAGAGGAVTAIVAYAATRPAAALRGAGVRRPRPGEAARLANIVAGLAPASGLPVPAVGLVDEGGPNALIGRRARRPTIAVTVSLLETYTRTELEAVVAHCLVRLASGGLWRAAAVAVFGGRDPVVGPHEDVCTAALTRYPPGLARALEAVEPRRGRDSVFWLAGLGPGHVSLQGRLEALADL